MSNRGDWINFVELCERVKAHGLDKSPRTLRRYYREKVISFRQVRRRAPVEFNWKTVEKELRIHDSRSLVSEAAELMQDATQHNAIRDLATKVAELTDLVKELVQAVRPEADERVFAGEQPKDKR